MTQSAREHGGVAQAGDWLEARGLPGQPSRRGQILELLGAPGHQHYRVRWDEQHESLVYPADGVILIPREQMNAEDAGDDSDRAAPKP